MALGVEQARHSNYPFLIYTRLIQYENVLERIDPIYVISWLTLNLGRVITNVLFSYLSFKTVLKQKNPRYILYLLSLIVGFTSLFISNRGIMVIKGTTFTDIHMYISFIVITLIPSIAMIIYFFRRKALKAWIEESKQGRKVYE